MKNVSHNPSWHTWLILAGMLFSLVLAVLVILIPTHYRYTTLQLPCLEAANTFLWYAGCAVFLAGLFTALTTLLMIRWLAHRPTAALALAHQKRIEAEDALQHLFYHDLLTHLPNRARFTELLEQLLQWSQSTQKLVALFSLNIVEFRELKQGLTPAQQELLIKTIAEHLQTIAPERAALGRIADSEFAVAISEFTNSIQIYTFAQHFFNSLNRIYTLNDYEIIITFNMGIAIHPIDTHDVHELLRNASQALYYASVSAQDRYIFYKTDMDSEIAARQKLLADLYHAVDKEQLCLYFQPQITLQEKKLYGFEALIRWQHPEYGLLSPAQFIPLAEESHLILEMGDWVIKKVFHQSAQWEKQYGLHLHASLNLSSRQLMEKNFLQKIVGQIKASGCNPQLIELEITESSMIDNKGAVLKTLQQLKTMGFNLVIDDFGTGYSSMSYLQQLPVKMLKIDKSFIDDLVTHVNSQAIVRAIIQVGHSLNLKIVAEGIETIEQLQLLQTYGCDIAQGYLISHPLSSDAFTLWMTNYPKFGS